MKLIATYSATKTAAKAASLTLNPAYRFPTSSSIGFKNKVQRAKK